MGKYVVTWKVRGNGTAQQNHDDTKSLLDTFAKWSPPADQEFQQFLGRVDGQGGYAVIETDNPAGLADNVANFVTWLEYEVIAVLDIMDSAQRLAAGAAFRESI